ncbi:MAG: hypothetical protein R3263_06335 [Myxococcota bacterium]|nr:hypothetical protein [Myxococcota bacterium]
MAIATARIPSESPSLVRDDPVETTLLELVQVIGEVTDDEREVVATVLHLLRGGRVRLVGSFRDSTLAEA